MRRDPAGAWTFEWRRSWAEVWAPAFLDQWTALFAAAKDAHVFQHPSLARAWSETCGADGIAEPTVGCGIGPGGVRMLLPWAVRVSHGRVAARRQLMHIGDDLFGYHDPLASEGAIDWTAVWQRARLDTADCCDEAMFRFVHAPFAAPASAPSGDESAVLRLDQHDDFEQLLAACSSNHRGDVRRRRRRLAERGDVALWIAAAGEGEAALSDWRTHGAPAYQQVWNDRNRRNTAWRPRFDDFIGRVLTDGLAQGWGHFAALRVNGESIAWHIGLADRGRLYWWIPAHRPAWEPFAPGKVLLAALVEALVTARWRELHFLAGAHPYKMAWRPETSDLRVVRWHSPAIRGRLLSWYDALRRSA